MSVEYCFKTDEYYDTDFDHCCRTCDCYLNEEE